MLDQLLTEIRACRHCEPFLPLGPRPVLRASQTSSILIVGQAPGTKVHASGIPWDDQSGRKLREWLDMENELFYDETHIAIIPMGFCYPGKGKGGDLPPRPECAELWHEKLLNQLKDIRYTLVLGQYAMKYFLGDKRKKNLTETVKAWKEYIDLGIFPLPHPSPRNLMWRRRNPWFEEEVVPEMRRRVWEVLGEKLG
ncbi:MAG: uracil-DNA glycosylase family protein [Bacteroidetes bacterium]|nr:uracil-DNA glycosylase family protein [Bacteroidota bacterium]